MILVSGATGTVGSEVVRALCEGGAPVRALVRSPEKADALRGMDCETAVGDFADPASLDRALDGADAFFLLTPPGPGQVEQEVAAIEAAERAGVRIVKLGVIGIADETNPFGRFVDNHRQAYARLQASSVPWTVLAPNDFMQNMLSVAAVVQAHGALPRMPATNGVSSVDARDIAAVAAHVLTTDGHVGAVYTVTGGEALTGPQMAERISAVLGREVHHVEPSPEETRESLTAAGLPQWIVDGLLELDQGYRDGKAEVVTDEVRKATGREPRRMEDFISDHRSAFA